MEVADQSEALRRIKEMGLFPTKLLPPRPRPSVAEKFSFRTHATRHGGAWISWGGRVKPARLAVVTRQLATLVEAGMPLLRGLRILRDQEETRNLKRSLEEVARAIEDGSSFGEALSLQPKIFNRLFINMVRAGEISGTLELTLKRLAEFMEKAQRIKARIQVALFYPCAVLTVAAAILALLMVFVVPRFKAVFDGLANGMAMPAFTTFVLNISETIKSHIGLLVLLVLSLVVTSTFTLRTVWGRWFFDRFKLSLPIVGPLFRKLAIARFARTLGTLAGSGVPILQALTIVKETTGNVVVGNLIAVLHENVKQGDPLAPTLKASPVFPAMVAGMVDVGEQTGALPDMLLKIADTYDDEVDNSASALTSLLEPVMIVFLAVIVGSIVIAMFLPLIRLVQDINPGSTTSGEP